MPAVFFEAFVDRYRTVEEVEVMIDGRGEEITGARKMSSKLVYRHYLRADPPLNHWGFNRQPFEIKTIKLESGVERTAVQ